MLDNTSSLYEHIKNRLATGYEYGDDGQVIEDNIPDHRVSYMSIREDHQGDVGVFEYLIEKRDNYSKISYQTLWISNVQISVVCKNGDIEGAKKYLLGSYNNILNDPESSNVYVINNILLNIRPTGKNKDGLQMVIMNIRLFYYINDNIE